MTTTTTTIQQEQEFLKMRPSKSFEYTKENITILPEKSNSLTVAERRHIIPASLIFSSKTKVDQTNLLVQIIQKLSLSQDTLHGRLHLLTKEMNPVERGQMWKQACQPNEKSGVLYQTLVKEKSLFYDYIVKDTKDERIKRVINAYCIYDTQIIYESHLKDLISPLFHVNLLENEVFSIFIRLMETYEMRQLYILNRQGLVQLTKQFDSIFQSHLPTLHQHLTDLHIQPDMYAHAWFLCDLLQHDLKLWDIVFLQGCFPTLLRTAFWILSNQQTALLNMTEPQAIIAFLQDQPKQPYDYQAMLDLAPLVNSLKPINKTDMMAELSQLQKQNQELAIENKKLRLAEMDGEAAQLKLVKRNTVLEKRVKKYKVKLANASVVEPTMAETKSTMSKRQDQFSNFVASLRDTGDFGALIAGALANNTESAVEDLAIGEVSDKEEENDLAQDLQNVTSELVQVKLEHFETCQQYQNLVAHYDQVTTQLQTIQASHTALCQKVIYLESELEDVVTERDQIYADQEEVLAMTMVAKKTASELQLEKLELQKQVDRLEQQVAELQVEKQHFFMPRSSFTEEVLSAHSILFQPKKAAVKEDHEKEEYKQELVESELRCRELEKLLAETKVKLVEYETGSTSARNSVLISRRNSSNRYSTASLSMLANRSQLRRESIESYASSTTSLTSLNSSQCQSKRSSMYSRIWNAFGSPPATPTTTTNVMMKDPNMMAQEVGPHPLIH